MKKVLPYVAIATLLGVITMVVPLMLLKPRYYELMTSRDEKNVVPKGSPAFLETLDGEEAPFEERGALDRAVDPSNLSSVGLMLVPSFLLALGVSVYLKKRMF